MPWTKFMTSKSLFQNTFNIGKAAVANLAEIIKIATIFIKTNFKDSEKVKRIKNYVLKWNLYLYFLI